MSRSSCAVAGVALVLSACAGVKTTEKGPKLDVELRCGFARLSEDSSAGEVAECDLDTLDEVYILRVSIDARSGQKTTEGSHATPEVFAAKAPAVTIDVDGQPVPTPSFKTSDVYEGVSYTYDELRFPETSKGKTLTVRAETTDDRGLQSNRVELKLRFK